MQDQANVIFSLYPTQRSWSVPWLVLEQIPKSGGENKTSGYAVKAKQKNTRDKQNPKKLKKQNCVWLMQQNVSDSLVGWREERLKIKVWRGDGWGNREYPFCIHHGLGLRWWVREFGLWLQRGALALSLSRSLSLSLSLVRFLHYHLSFVRERHSFLLFSAIDYPSISLAMCCCSVSHAAVSMAERRKKSLSSQARMGKNIKTKHMEPPPCAFFGDQVWPNQNLPG